jgi:hypothetical protein
MPERESEAGATERIAERGDGPQTLAQLQATGAEVVGSDGETVGDLKDVGDADFLVGRTLRRDLRLPVNRVREVTSNKIVLDLPAAEAKELGERESMGETAPAAAAWRRTPEKRRRAHGDSEGESRLAPPT